MINEAERYRYRAFLSYSHLDNREYRSTPASQRCVQWANWLHDSLETYRVPLELVGTTNARGQTIPNRIYPVFQDEKELPASSDLSSTIRRALEDSECLVVICSPRSANSAYVNEEIRYFKELGRHDRILPITIDGEPNASDRNKPGSDSSQECFGAALRYSVGAEKQLDPTRRDADPLCADARWGEPKKEVARQDLHRAEGALATAKLRLIAGILGIGFDDLANRDTSRQLKEAKVRAKRARTIAAGFLLLAIAAIAGGVYALWQERRARDTLAKANFQEATRLLDDIGDTGKALAFLGASLEGAAYPAARERLFGLMLDRSWLVEKASTPLRSSGLGGCISRDLSHQSVFLPTGPSGEGLLEVSSVWDAPDAGVRSIPINGFESQYFTDDSDSLVVGTRDAGARSVELWRIDTAMKTGGIPLPDGVVARRISPTGRLALFVLPTGALRVVATESSRTVTELPLEDGRQWLTEGVMTKSIVAAFDETDSLVAVADATQTTQDEEPHADARRPSLLSVTTRPAVEFRIRVFRISTGKEIWHVEDKGKTSALALSPGGSHLVYTHSRDTVRDWRVLAEPLAPGAQAWSKPLGDASPMQLAFTPDGLSVLAETWGNPAESRRRVTSFDVFRDGLTRFSVMVEMGVRRWAFSHDSRRMALLTGKPELRVISLPDGKEEIERLDVPLETQSVSFSHDDGSVLVGSPAGSVAYAIQVSPLEPRRVVPAVPGPVRGVAVSPDGRYLVLAVVTEPTLGHLEIASLDADITDTRETCAGRPASVDLEFAPGTVAYSPNGRQFAVASGDFGGRSDDEVLHLYELTPGAEGDPTKGWKKSAAVKLPAPAAEVSFNADSSLLMVRLSRTAEASRRLLLIEPLEGRAVPSFVEHAAAIDDAAWSRDGSRLATVGADSKMTLWDVGARREIASCRFDSFPDSVAFAPDGSVVGGARLLTGRGEVRALSPQGHELWATPWRSASGVHLVAVDPQGATVAIGTRGQEVHLLDLASGQPLASPIRLEAPLTSLRFVPRPEGSILSTGSGIGNKGSVELWDVQSGRRISDRVPHTDAVLGLEPLPAGGGGVSWSMNAAVVSRFAAALDADKATPDYIALTGELGGWSLNGARALEPFRPKVVSTMPPTSQWQRLRTWLRSPVEGRTVDPFSPVKLIDRLTEMAHGSRTDVEAALDIKPDFGPALGQQWFYLADDAAKEAFMATAADQSRAGRLAREQAWGKLKATEGARAIMSDPKALRLAEFFTRQALRKQPRDPSILLARAQFLRMSGRLDEAKETLRRSAEVDGQNLDTREQLARLLIDEGDRASGTAELDALADILTTSGRGDLETVCRLGVLRMEESARAMGNAGLKSSLDWMAREIPKRALRQLNPGDALQLESTSGKVTNLYAHIPTSDMKAAEQFNSQLAALIASHDISVSKTSATAGILANAAWCAVLRGDMATGLSHARKAVDLSTAQVGPQVSYAHALLGSGQAPLALDAYRAILAADDGFGGSLSKELYLGFQLMERHGIPLSGAAEIRKTLDARLAKAPDTGVTVYEVLPRGQGAKAGIRVGDRLIKYQGAFLVDLPFFVWDRQLEAAAKETERHTLTIRRSDKEMDLVVTSGLLGLGLQVDRGP